MSQQCGGLRRAEQACRADHAVKYSLKRLPILLCCLAAWGWASAQQPTQEPEARVAPVAVPSDKEVLAAAAYGQAALLRDLLRRGGNPRAMADDGIPAIAFAVRSKNADSVAALLERLPDLVNQPFRIGQNDFTPLAAALFERQLPIVQLLIKAGASLDWTKGQGVSALGIAVAMNDVDALRVLVGSGADPKQQLPRHATLLHLAVSEDRAAVIGALVDDYGVNANQRNDFGDSPLMIAAYDGKLESARALLERGAWAYPRDTFGDTALSIAKRRIKDPTQLAAMIAMLVSHGAPADGKNRPIDDAYLDAVHRGDLPAVKQALAAGADIDARRVFTLDLGITEAVSLAAQHPQVLSFLIERGINIHACSDYEFTALHTAAGRDGSVQSIEMLVQHGLDVNGKSKNGISPLAQAVNMNKPGAVKALLALGASTDARGPGNMNLLQLAQIPPRSPLIAAMLREAGAKEDPPGTPQPCQFTTDTTPLCSIPGFIGMGDSPRVEKAIEGGIDINARGPLGRSFLMIALGLPKARSDLPAGQQRLYDHTIQHRIELAHYLLQHGIDVKATDDQGLSALHFVAADPRLVDFIDLLVTKGADPNLRSGSGLTPLRIAEQAGNQEAVRALLKDGTRSAP
jgi:ankyrin repeat protein